MKFSIVYVPCLDEYSLFSNSIMHSAEEHIAICMGGLRRFLRTYCGHKGKLPACIDIAVVASQNGEFERREYEDPYGEYVQGYVHYEDRDIVLDSDVLSPRINEELSALGRFDIYVSY